MSKIFNPEIIGHGNTGKGEVRKGKDEVCTICAIAIRNTQPKYVKNRVDKAIPNQ